MPRGMTVTVTPQRGRTFTNNGQMFIEECYACGITFAMPDDYQAHRKRLKDTFYCPSGHGQSYIRSEADELRREVENKQRALDAAFDRLNAEKAEHAKTERERRRIVKRVEAGVCIGCNRTFQNLAQHMASEHVDAPDGGGFPALATVMLVHKRAGYGWGARKDGSHIVKCGTQRVPLVRAVTRWKDVTCADCLRDPGAPGVAVRVALKAETVRE